MRVELKAEIAQTNARLAVVEETLKDLAAQLLMLSAGAPADHQQCEQDRSLRGNRLRGAGDAAGS
jgi:hypothetical protein